jgi:hypothetical protein
MVFMLWLTSVTAKDKGCPFTRISPVPEGKAVIYLYKVGWGRDVFPISVNGVIVTAMKKPGYYSMVVAPGKYDIFVSMAGFFNTPTTTLNAEAGREYFLELLTRFNGSFKEVPENNALKDLKGTRLLLPVKVYEKAYQTEAELRKDPVLAYILERYPKDMEEISAFLSFVGAQSTRINIGKVFDGGNITITSGQGLGRIDLNYRQAGFALSCDPPILR